MLVSDAQVRKLMEEMSKHGKIGLASMRAGLDRKTGRKYMKLQKLPSEIVLERNWRTRRDPFEQDWPLVVTRLEDAPALEAKTLFEWLCERFGDKYQEGQLRTFQRKVRTWRALQGPPKAVFFAQEHCPGEALQTDFTNGNELSITVLGEPLRHLICHSVLPYSNWEWMTVTRSESTYGLRRGIQSSVFVLGKVPNYSQTDNTTAATHKGPNGKRLFNDDYLALMRHLGMKARTIGVGEKEQNGDVEALNGALKRAINQHLLLRGSRDFQSVESYELFLQQVASKRNSLRSKRIAEELEAMRKLSVSRLPDFEEFEVRVSSWCTIRIRRNSYSVPSRLINEKVKVRVYDEKLDVYFKGVHQLTVPRLLGDNGHYINYRHIIWSLVRKPGAFKRYKYREDLYPSTTFRRAYDALCQAYTNSREADLNYLRILHLAASTVEADVETALEILDEQKIVPTVDEVKALVTPQRPDIPILSLPEVELFEYDSLLEACKEVGK